MKTTWVQCEICGGTYSTFNIKKHLAWHERVKNNPPKDTIKFNEHREFNCRFCDKLCHSLNSLRQHETRCSKNPDHIEYSFKRYQQEHGSWNKGLTVASGDPRLIKLSESVKKSLAPRARVRSELELELDDDGKLYSKWLNKRNNAKQEGLECLLTFDEYCQLVKDAGLKSSDLGFSGGGYVLARYNDQGDYILGNCRFITQKENSAEKVITDACRESNRRNIQKMIEYNRKDKDRGKKISRGIDNSPYYQELRRKAAIKEAERLKNIDKSHSTYGCHWITDGTNSRFWNPDSGSIPEGWHLGRKLKKDI